MYFEKVRSALAAQFEIDPDKITMDTNLIDDLGADSLDVVELIMNIEDEFGISISDEEAANLFTVQRIVDFLEKLQSERIKTANACRAFAVFYPFCIVPGRKL